MPVPTDDAGWLELIRESMPPFWRVIAEGSGGRIWERDGLSAAIVPASPKRSFFNSVLYTEPCAMIEAVDELATVYGKAGISAWTVWVPEGDSEVAAALQAAGHVLDATPRAMATPLSELRPPDPSSELEIRKGSDYELVSRLNEAAYGLPPGDFPVIGGDPEGMRTYFAYLDGEAVGCAGVFARDSDAELVYVAVLPEGRGRGISARLCARALADAAEQGFETTTLQATALGRPVYEKLGYRDFGELQMWERRNSD